VREAVLAPLIASGSPVEQGRVRLDDPQSVWVIDHGYLDLFAVEVRADGSAGSRRFLFTATASALVFGVETAAGERRFALQGSGPSATRVRRSPLQTLRQLADRPDSAPVVNQLIDAFIAQASSAMTVTAAGNGDAWERLARTREQLADWLTRHPLAADQQDRARLTRKALAEQQMIERGVIGLASVLHTVQHAGPADSDGGPLLAACRAVGEPARIEFVAAPSWEVDRKVRDPLASICRASRVRQRRVALRGAWWRTSGRPLLGYLKEDHQPVALLPLGHARYRLFDPSSGQQTVVDEAVSASLDEYGFEFYRPSPGTPLKLLDLGRMALAEARGDLRRLLLAALGAGLLGLVLPIATSKVFSDIIPMAVPANIVPLLATLVSFTLASTFFDLTRAMALIRIEGRTNAALQSTVIDRLLALPVRFFRAYSIGDLALRAGAINSVRDLLSGAALTTIIEGAFSIVTLGLLLYYSPTLTLVAIGTLFASIIFTSVFAIVSLRFERRRQAADGKVAGLVFEMIGGIAKLRVAGAERRAFAVWTRHFREERQLAFRVGTYENFVAVFNEVLPILSRIALLGTTGYLLTSGTPLDTGAFVAFNAAFGAFLASGIALNSTLIGSLNIIPMMERARPILEASLEAPEARPDPGELTGHIEVSHVSFRHHTDGPAILSDVSVHARPGEFVALVGPSGAGKSTLLRLLLGFDSPESGAIYFDEQDLATVDLTAVRAQMGVVLQSSRLLAGDVFQNIVGSSPLTIADAWAAAEMAGLDDDLHEMPMGMHTVVSEGGSTLSGGQRQRLLIARALVRNPRIILFDEATSALDNRTQEIVSESLENLNATRIVIAHRLSTVRNADRIYVLEAGKVVQHGTYDELSQVPGLFATMVARQLA